VVEITRMTVVSTWMRSESSLQKSGTQVTSSAPGCEAVTAAGHSIHSIEKGYDVAAGPVGSAHAASTDTRAAMAIRCRRRHELRRAALPFRFFIAGRLLHSRSPDGACREARHAGHRAYRSRPPR